MSDETGCDGTDAVALWERVKFWRARAEALENYAHHIPGCDYRGGEGECDCGLRELEVREPGGGKREHG